MILLLDEFFRKFSGISQSVLEKSPDPIVKTGLEALYQAVQKSDKVYFSNGTMKMLIEKLQHFDETCNEIMEKYNVRDHIQGITERALANTGVWIEFNKPIDQSIPGAFPIAALFVFVPSVYLPTGNDRNQLYLIDSNADIFAMMFAYPGQAWQFEKTLHRCPTGKCTKEYGAHILCDVCRYILVAWGQIFALSAIISGQYLATTRYEEKEFVGVRRVPKKHSGKTKAVVTKRIFKVIDANQIVIDVPKQEIPHVPEHRGSWLLEAIAEGDVEYREKKTRPFERTYRHERYVNMQGKSTQFPEGIVRMQPVRKSLEGKRITKVVASDYEE